MPQMTIYLDQETDRQVRDACAQSGEPTSKWIADAIRHRIEHEWPSDILEMLGTWPADFPETDELRKIWAKIRHVSLSEWKHSQIWRWTQTR